VIEKTRDRPRFPTDYGIDTSPEGMLEWATVEVALSGARTYWIATAGSRPHLTPIWGAWIADHLFIEGGPTTRWARNLAADPAATAGVDSSGLQVMVEGSVMLVEPDGDTYVAIASQYEAKYPYRPDPGAMYRLRPEKALAWSIASIEDFAATPTRFKFEEEK